MSKHKKPKREKVKDRKPNGWELNSGLFEIYWNDNVATIVKVSGSIFHAAHRVRLIAPRQVPKGRKKK